ncbi:hypothetical protein B0H11DRAFT_1951192 [Mycena galericulata]|nr:hypothetical protein B0H11DRAFT_1951192 [Mycena galericulata]
MLTVIADPVFYLRIHHANLGRVWWVWQKVNLPYRSSDVSGRLSVVRGHHSCLSS